MHKLRSTISWCTVDEIAWFKRQNDLCSTHYKTHTTIARINEFEKLTFLKHSVKSLLLLIQFAKTDEECWLGRWLVKNFQLTGAWIRVKSRLPLKLDVATVRVLDRFLPQMLATVLYQHLQKKIQQPKATNIDEFLVKWWRKVYMELWKKWENLRILLLDLKKWFPFFAFC